MRSQTENILTEALVNLATNASLIIKLYKFCKVKALIFYKKLALNC